MVFIAIRFPSGRYHATPWGRHVNEGAIEWPPSPWRLLRALIATGFSRHGWSDIPAPAPELLGRLSATPPVYHVPPASTGHTRHYMPTRTSTTRVLDAFAWVGRSDEAVIGVEWPVELDAATRALLGDLVEALPYLGRAESITDARLVEELPAGLTRVEHAEAAPGPGVERIDLLGPLEPAAFEAWRADAVERAAERLLGAKRSKAEQKGKKPPERLTARELARLAESYPSALVDALLADTPALQKAGWSQPPGTRWLCYWRPEDALEPSPAPAPRRPAPLEQGVDTALLALTSDTRHGEVLPHLHDTLLRAEAVHRALVAKSDPSAERGSRRGSRRASPCFTGRDDEGNRLAGHRHAYVLPIDLDGDGRLDHVIVHAPMGLDERARRAARTLRRTWVRQGLPEVFVTLAGLGRRVDMASLDPGRGVPHLAVSDVWQSATPFVPPRHLKPRGRNALEGQVRAELASHGKPSPVSVEVELEGGHWLPATEFWTVWRRAVLVTAGAPPGTSAPSGDVVSAHAPLLARRWRHFRRERARPGRRPPAAIAVGLRLRFDEPVRGPIALGYASHFGLGLFRPAGSSGR